MNKSQYSSIQSALKNNPCPAAILDSKIYTKNVNTLEQIVKSTDKFIRIGSKSIRIPQLIDELQKKSWIIGILGFNAHEISFYQDNFSLIDYLLAYPIFTDFEADLLARGAKRDPSAKITAMVDCDAHLRILEKAAKKFDTTLYVCVDVNMSTKYLGQYAGSFRSPINSAKDALFVVNAIKKHPHIKFRGIMGYESQIASAADTFLYKQMKKDARKKVNILREEVVSVLENEGFHCEIVNGGGSGSLLETMQENSITEIGLGSALFKSYIFDAIEALDNFDPSLFMALRIVRKPTPLISTAFSGGYYCSQSGKGPIVVYPTDIKIISMEQFGEVQTPFKHPRNMQLNLGDVVICRLAKAGEPLERFKEVLEVENGEIKRRLLTYRGHNVWLG
jgi:D-serine deaminase-like pyridoxal phosphate-dependent protein